MAFIKRSNVEYVGSVTKEDLLAANTAEEDLEDECSDLENKEQTEE